MLTASCMMYGYPAATQIPRLRSDRVRSRSRNGRQVSTQRLPPPLHCVANGELAALCRESVLYFGLLHILPFREDFIYYSLIIIYYPNLSSSSALQHNVRLTRCQRSRIRMEVRLDDSSSSPPAGAFWLSLTI